MKAIKEKAKSLQPTVQIGKSGLTDAIIKEIKKQLSRKRLIKIKFLRSALEAKDKKQLAKEVTKKTNAELVDQVGFVVVLKKK